MAQPALVTMARAHPPVWAKCLREKTTGAATAMLVVNTAAVGTAASVVMRAKSSGAG